MKFAADNQIINADADELKEAVSAAVNALDDADRQSLKAGFASIYKMISDVLMLDQKNINADRYVPFESAGLRKDVSELVIGNEASRFSAAKLNDILSEAIN